MITIAWNGKKARFTRDDALLNGLWDGSLIMETKDCRKCPYCYTDLKIRGLVDIKGICFRGKAWKVLLSYDKKRECAKFPNELKKVSFQVRKNYYDEFVAGTKTEELRAFNEYWFSRLILPGKLPTIAVISCGPYPAMYFEIAKIFIDRPENVLGRPLSEQGRKDLKAFDSATDLCIVTKMGRCKGVKILPG